MIILITGNCGTGKTWVMKQLAEHFGISKIYSYSTGLYTYLKKEGVILLGKYDGSTFEGSDRLSMAVMQDNEKVKPVFDSAKYIIGEGDRFTNSKFIAAFNPVVLKIKGSGEEGRIKRGSTQTERHLKSISTRVENIKADYEFENSEQCLNWVKENCPV